METQRQSGEAGQVFPPVSPSAVDDRRYLFEDELAKRWGVSRRTLQRRQKEGTFPIPSMSFIDNKKRFSLREIEAFEDNVLKNSGVQPGLGRKR